MVPLAQERTRLVLPGRIGNSAHGLIHRVLEPLLRARCAQPFSIFCPASGLWNLIVRRSYCSDHAGLPRFAVFVPRWLPESSDALIDDSALEQRNFGLLHDDLHDVVGLCPCAILPPVEIVVHDRRVPVTASWCKSASKQLKWLWDRGEVRHESPRNDHKGRSVLPDLMNQRALYHPVRAIGEPTQQGRGRTTNREARIACNRT